MGRQHKQSQIYNYKAENNRKSRLRNKILQRKHTHTDEYKQTYLLGTKNRWIVS